MDGNKGLKEVKELIEQEKLPKALQLVNNLDKNTELATDQNFRFRLFDLKCQILRLQEDHNLLVKLAEDVVNVGKKFGASLQAVDSLINIAEALLDKGGYPESLNVAKQAEIILSNETKTSPEFKQREAALLNIIGISWRYLCAGDEEKALDNHHRSLALYKELGQKEGIASSLMCISWFLMYYKHNFDSSLEYAQQSLIIAEEIGHKKIISYALTGIANYSNTKLDFENSLQYHQKVLAIREELGDKILISMSFSNIAFSYAAQGNFVKAFEYYQKILEISTQIGHKRGIAGVYESIGNCYLHGGNLNGALEYHQKALAISKELGNRRKIVSDLSNVADIYNERGEINIALEMYHQSLALLKEQDKSSNLYASIVGAMGRIYWQKNELKQAYKYLQESLNLFNVIKNEWARTLVLYYIILLCIDLNYIEEANSYLKSLKSVPGQAKNKARSQAIRIAEALILKTSSRTRNRFKAEELLESVVNEEILYHSFTIVAMIHLCDLLLYELRTSGELDILEEIKSLVQRLLEISKDQHSYSLLVETYVLQSKLFLLELDLPGAQNLLTQAKKLAEEKNLENLVLKVNEEQKALQTQLSKWNEFVKRKASISEIIEFTQIEDYVERVVQDRLIRRDVNVRTYSEEAHQFFSEMEKKTKSS